MNQDKQERFSEIAKALPRITVLNDGPLLAEKGFQDSFNLAVKLAPIYDVIRHPETETPLAIAIYGDWGTGKTSAMTWLEGLLKEWNSSKFKKDEGKKVRPVWFYPWKYHKKEDVWRGLVSEVIIASIDARQATAGRITKAVKQFGIFLGRSFLHALSSIKLKAKMPDGSLEGELDFASLRSIYDEYQQAAHPEEAYLNEFESSLRSWIEETISSHDERLVVFIDDLDRCLPNVALQVLEALKLYLNIKDLIFFIGVDKVVIDQLVRWHYVDLGVEEEKSKKYLDKMFQIEITMTPTDVQAEDFLAEQLKILSKITSNYWNDELEDSEQEIFRKVILKLSKRNPREIKRLLNSMIIHGTGAKYAA